MKKIIIILLAVLLTVSVGFIIPVIINRDAGNVEYIADNDVPNVNNESNNSRQTNSPKEDLNGNLNTPESISSNRINSKASGEDTTGKDNKPRNTKSTGINGNQEGKLPQGTPIVTPINTPKVTASPSDNIKNNSQYVSIKPAVSATPKNDTPKSWIDAKLDEYKNDIDPSDIPDIKRIYSRIDIGYVQGISQSGMTDEATQQIKDYLRKTLGSDYERAKELFYTYSYLL
ncbi:MAG TPA: hypothetical protein VIO64_14095 [Pseudobacteroides sp.]|uniref:hypothetical protein n=1 Tax=Pseudobacteroides sp. TaxID=1968840 RepID=UPI002F941D9F